MELFPNESFPNETQDDRVKSKSVTIDMHMHVYTEHCLQVPFEQWQVEDGT